MAEKAQAWEAAVEAWKPLDEEAAEACQAEVARYRHLPYLKVMVTHDNLRLNHWTTLNFSVKNEGYGLARFLIIRARGGQFEGQVAETRRIMNLKAGAQQADWLDVRPLAPGSHVPLRVSIEYQDEQGKEYTWFRTLYLPVRAA